MMSSMESPEVRVLVFGLVTTAIGGAFAWLWITSLRVVYARAWPRGLRTAAWAFVALWALTSLGRVAARALSAPDVLYGPLTVTSTGTLLVVLLTTPLLVGARLLLRWLEARDRARLVERAAADVEPASREPSPEARVEAPASPARASTEVTHEASGFTRRALALGVVRSAPLAGVSAATFGLGEGMTDAVLNEVEMQFPGLPPALEGLRILQYSDVHLGQFIDLREIERLARLGEAAKPDLVVLTGDVADDLDLLPDALGLFAGIRPRLGTFASIGNHEYFRGLHKARRAYERGPVPLLMESGTVIPVGDARLHLAGADDPRFLGLQSRGFFESTVDKALDGGPSDAFHVLLSHRPEGFDAARTRGLELTLAGHTHGAQVGFAERSVLEPLMPDRYLWGPYQQGGSRLYTSSGTGHWMPFRIGCPREIVVLTLRRGPIDAPAVKRRLRLRA
jgi:predicted MPP superfamily phosphohydrolase